MHKNIIILFISIIILNFSTKEFGYMFLSVPTFLTLSYNLSDLALKLFRKTEKNINKNKNLEFISMIGVVSIFFVIRDFEQTIGGYVLFWKFSFFSLLFSILCVLILNIYYNFNNEKRFYNILSISVCFFFLIPNIGICINKNISLEKENTQTVVINYKNITHQSEGSDNYNIFFTTEYDKNERLDIKKDFYDSISNHQKVLLTMRKGILGYNYVKKVEKL